MNAGSYGFGPGALVVAADAVKPWARAWDYLETVARRAVRWPWATARLLVANYVLAGVLILIGVIVLGDPHQLFRDLNPATWLNAAELFAAGVLGVLVFRSRRPRPAWRSYDDPWLLGGAALMLLAVDDASELHEHVGIAIQALTPIDHPLGIDNPGDALVDLLAIAFFGLVVLRHLLEYLASWAVAAQLAVAAAFALASVGIDLFGPAGDWEFVLEESLKLTATTFILGAFAARLRAAGKAAPIAS